MSATLPALALTDDGRILAPDTGEVLDEEGASLALADTLRTYARAKVELDSLNFRLMDAQNEALATLDADPKYAALSAQAADARNTMLAIAATLDGLFAGRDGKVSIETPDALVTWGKARETWSLAHPASYYAGRQAHADLARFLQSHITGSTASVEIARLVLGWLAPTAKVSDLPGASITVRAGKGGAK